MSTRLIALVEQPVKPEKIRQFRGLPPDLTGGTDTREELPWPRVLLIEETPEGIFLFRFTKDSTCVGDTWHLDIEEAKEQASFEYGDYLTEWREVPLTVDDALGFGLEQS
jgi:hypothetical protein